MHQVSFPAFAASRIQAVPSASVVKARQSLVSRRWAAFNKWSEASQALIDRNGYVSLGAGLLAARAVALAPGLGCKQSVERLRRTAERVIGAGC